MPICVFTSNNFEKDADNMYKLKDGYSKPMRKIFDSCKGSKIVSVEFKKYNHMNFSDDCFRDPF